jgi:hypothetical protein
MCYNRKRKKSESSGDVGWQRPDKSSKCSEIFSHDPFKWNKHNIEKHINSHYESQRRFKNFAVNIR